MRPGQLHRILTKTTTPIGSILNLIAVNISAGKVDPYLKPRILFIIGAPRSGTTLLYQSLSHALDVVYPNNLTAAFLNAPVFAIRLGERLACGRPHRSFNSVHGFPTGDGFRGPNEWEGFLRNQIFKGLRCSEKEQQAAISMLNQVTTISESLSLKPTLFKGLNAVLNINELTKAFPNARFLAIEREPRDVMRSMLLAKRLEQKPKETLWYIQPPELKSIEFATEEEQIYAQIEAIGARINSAVKSLDESIIKTVQYSHLCAYPSDVVTSVKMWLDWEVAWRASRNLPSSFEKHH